MNYVIHKISLWADAKSWTPLKTLQIPQYWENMEPMTLGDNQRYFPNGIENEVKRKKLGN